MQTRFQKRVISAAVVALLGSGLLAARSDAALTITLSEPGQTPATYTASPSTPGQVVVTGTYGTFDLFNLEIGASDRTQTPTPSLATLQIQGIVESTSANGSANTLTIVTSDDGYGFPGALGSTDFMDSSLGGTLAPPHVGDEVTFQSTATATSGSPGTNVSTGTQTYIYPGPIPQNNISFDAQDVSATFSQGAEFDLTNTLTITLQSPFDQANVAGTTTVSLVPSRVPEPTSAMVILGGLGSMILGRRRRA